MDFFEQIAQLDFPMPLPETLLEVHQRFDAPKVDDIAAATIAALNESGILDPMQPGDTVAVGAGSRGIANLPAIVKATVDGLRAAGMKPFVMPAMGSHGGATADVNLMPAPERSRTFGTCTATGPMPVRISRLGRWPLRTTARRPSISCTCAYSAKSVCTSASMAR